MADRLNIEQDEMSLLTVIGDMFVSENDQSLLQYVMCMISQTLARLVMFAMVDVLHL